jgi:competence protein ComFC
MLQPLLHSIKQLVMPQSCVVCHALLLQRMKHICLTCAEATPEVGVYYPNNEIETIISGRFPINWAYSWIYYQEGGIAQKMMQELKYRGNTAIGKYMGEQLAINIMEQNLSIRNSVLLPIPLNEKKLIKRGYNQAQVLADAMSEILQIPVVDTSVLRIVNTSTQTKKNREERQYNMHDAFELNNKTTLEHKQVILVDDVITTGATLEACAKVIQDVPGVSFAVATVAKAIR